jgi:hypothetical protein
MADDDNDTNQDLNEETLDASASTDSDELGERVGDDGYDAPDDWAGADRSGTTADEERMGESLDEKLSEERPDTPLEELPDRPVGATPVDELDESVDDVVADEPADDVVVADEPADDVVVADEPADGTDVSYD